MPPPQSDALFKRGVDDFMDGWRDVRPRQAEASASRIIDGEVLIVQSDEGFVSVLNDVGTLVWELCDGTRTVADIIEAVCREYDVTEETARTDTLEFLRELDEKGLVSLTDA